MNKPSAKKKPSSRPYKAIRPPKVELHPITIKQFKRGHPWVTKDQFTNRFPKRSDFLIGGNLQNSRIAFLLHDPTHPKVKARLWSLEEPFPNCPDKFQDQLFYRIKESFQLREKLNLTEERDNFYLCFGEADRLPGLFILKLGPVLLLQYYSNFWTKYQTMLMKAVTFGLKHHFPESNITSWWAQNRNLTQEKYFTQIFPKKLKQPKEIKFVISEFGIKYNIQINESYDTGIYTDMASIRKSLTPYFKKNGSLLNLYSYTGAYSLFALNKNMDEVHSVDLSKKYMDLLEDNISQNSNLNSDNHYPHLSSVDKAIDKFIKDNKTFDFIICDPPSSSSDGKKVTNSLNSYQHLLPKIAKILKPEGYTAIFINTQKVTWKKFTESLEKTIEKNKTLKLEIIKKITQKEDCPTLPRFPEGSYLKGYLIKRS